MNLKLWCFILVMLVPSRAWAEERPPSFSNLVQAPVVAAPGRGSVGGTLGNMALGPADLVRGGASLGLPVVLPTERGKPLVEIAPRYSTDAGLGPWGMGWQNNLTITRFRHLGDLNYRDDSFTSPWGELAQGNDGFWYPAGLQRFARLSVGASGWSAQLADGTVWTFAKTVAGEAGGYAWFVTDVRSPLGEVTAFSYTANASGWPYLATMTYGGRGGRQQYEVAFHYADAPALTNYRAGRALTHDKRIDTIEARVWHVQDRAYKTRWTYKLAHTQDNRGMAYYLASMQRIFADGTAEAKVSYEYAMAMERIAQAEVQIVPELHDYMTSNDPNMRVMKADTLSFIDIDQDGIMDFATPYGGLLMHHTAAGWKPEPFVATVSQDQTDFSCLPWLVPRRLVRLDPHDALPSVLITRALGWDMNEIVVCDYFGKLLAKKRFDATANWRPGPTTKLADLNRDHKPDFIDWRPAGYTVAENVSHDGEYDFVQHPRQPLEPQFDPLAIWVQDMNGDGLVDLVAKHNSGLFVWWGLGNFRFLNPAQKFPVYTQWAEAWPPVYLKHYEVSFVDANNDGLMDLLLTRHGSAWLHINNGKAFEHTPMEGGQESHRQFILGQPVVQDFSGRGNVAVTFRRLEDEEAVALELTTAATGLMTAAEDGKGTRVEFRYDRAAPKPGVPTRPPVLVSTEVKHGGVPAQVTNFAYLDPTLHPEGRFLLGYNAVEAQRPDLAERVEFINDATSRGLLRKVSRQNTQSPVLVQETVYDYSAESFRSLPFLRASQTSEVWRDPLSQQSLSRRTQYTRYEQDFCPTETTAVAAAGTLKSSKTLAMVPGLADLPHCLAGEESLVGQHTDGALDFVYRTRIARNALGQVTEMAQVGGGDVIAQQVEYDAEHRPVRIAQPGHGAQTVSYDSHTGLVASLIATDGVESRVAARDAVTDAILTLATDRGGASPYRQYFRHDGQERMCKRWDDRPGYSETTPLEVLTYRDTAADKPGMIDSQLLVDATRGTTQRSAALFRGDGQTLGGAKRIPEGWLLTALQSTDPQTLIQKSLFKGVVGSADLERASFAGLYAGTTELDVTQNSGLGGTLFQDHLVQQGVHSVAEMSYAIDARGLRLERLQNQSRRTATHVGMDGKTLAFTDAAGHVTAGTYDALARLRRVTLADGTRHTIDLDMLGRPSFMSRDGVAQVAYKYAPGTGLLEQVSYAGRDGRADRVVHVAYDTIGRKVREVSQAVQTNVKAQVVYLYDGQGPLQSRQPGQRGFLTAVVGDAFSKVFTYTPDGAVEKREETVDGWRTLTEALAYYGDGTVKSSATTVASGSGVALSRVRVETRLDSVGRAAGTLINGEPLCEVAYGPNGELAQSQCPNDTTFSFSRDVATHRLNGIYAESTAWSAPASMTWELSKMGTVASERLDVGGQCQERRYDYDDRDFLTHWQANGAARDVYGYGAAGLRAVAASTLPTYDHAGRITRLGGRVLTYGPDGQVATVVDAAGTQTTYVYDESGHRILQKVNGLPTVAHLGGDTVDGSRHLRPFDIGGHVVGALVDGVYRPVLTDIRGTIIVDDDGVSAWPTPFGKRSAPTDLAIAMDYAGGTYDPMLGTVRMGMRDYDPTTGQFLTPDPAVLSDPGLCMVDPVQCNLYGYARNNPLAFADNEGEFAHILIGAGIGGLAGAAGEGWAQYRQGEFNARRLAIATIGGAVTFGVVAAVPQVGLSVLARGTAIGLLTAEGNRTTRSMLGDSTTPLQYFTEGVTAGLGVGLGRGTRTAPVSELEPAPMAGANDASQGALLRKHLGQLEKYGAAGTKELQNGRIRYYGEISIARTPGQMVGRRLVREWNPATDATRTWHETLDQAGRTRIVRPETGGAKTHYLFDEAGNYAGKR